MQVPAERITLEKYNTTLSSGKDKATVKLYSVHPPVPGALEHDFQVTFGLYLLNRHRSDYQRLLALLALSEAVSGNRSPQFGDILNAYGAFRIRELTQADRFLLEACNREFYTMRVYYLVENFKIAMHAREIAKCLVCLRILDELPENVKKTQKPGKRSPEKDN